MCYFVFSLLVQILRYILFPFSLIYWFITSVRNYLYDIGVFKSFGFDIPVIVVGNLSVGGTGKTPMVEYLIRLLSKDFKVAVLSRGYKRKSKGFVLAKDTVSAEFIGDEPFQYFNKFKNIQVAVDADRVNGINQLLENNNKPEVVILDDAFQHKKVKGNCNILLTTYNDLFVNDFVLPTGNLRESRKGAKRAQVIVVTKCPNSISESEKQLIAKKIARYSSTKVFFSTIEYDESLKGGEEEFNVNDLENKEVLLVTGIANPKPLTSYLTDKNVKFTHLEFSDHHHFSDKDIQKINDKFHLLEGENKIILTTEKDYVRMFDKVQNLHYISIKIKINNQNLEFENIIRNYVG